MTTKMIRGVSGAAADLLRPRLTVCFRFFCTCPAALASPQLVDAHNGTVAVSSVVGKGSTFVVALPLKQPDSGASGHGGKGGKPKHASSGGKGQGRGGGTSRQLTGGGPNRKSDAWDDISVASGSRRVSLQIQGGAFSTVSPQESTTAAFPLAKSRGYLKGALVLCVDSDDADQLILGDAITSMGLAYASALDAEAAVAFLELNKAAPNVIMFDEKVPPEGMLAVRNCVREAHPRAQVAVVMISSNSGKEALAAGSAVEADDFITKVGYGFSRFLRVER